MIPIRATFNQYEGQGAHKPISIVIVAVQLIDDDFVAIFIDEHEKMGWIPIGQLYKCQLPPREVVVP